MAESTFKSGVVIVNYRIGHRNVFVRSVEAFLIDSLTERRYRRDIFTTAGLPIMR